MQIESAAPNRARFLIGAAALLMFLYRSTISVISNLQCVIE
jgi:hypothetical protein